MIFILGIERSATTWVANILDHHPAAEVYMEPLSTFTSRYKQWPNRFTRLDNMEQKADYFNKELKLLKRHRKFLLTRFASGSFPWQIDLQLAQFLVQKKMAPDAIKDFLELNFHRKGEQNPVSKILPAQTAIKELRLNFNAGLILEIDNSARVLVIIREPASCIRSILYQIENGNLVELAKDLAHQYGQISPQTVCKYWVESYSTLIDTLEQRSIPHKIVNHTELLKNPTIVVDKIFGFLKLPVTNEIKQYLISSNQHGSGKHSTKRNSEVLLAQLKNDYNNIYPGIKQELAPAHHHPVLRQYIGK